MKYRLSDIQAISGGTLCGVDPVVDSVLTDSRQQADTPQPLFVAIRGRNHDGHAYIEDMLERGVQAFLTDKQFDPAPYLKQGAGFLQTEDPLLALQKWAAVHRSNRPVQVISVTGSNGKTVVKEWFSRLWDQPGTFFRSPRSYNSQLGVPLSVLMIPEDAHTALIEAGISEKGEMQRLEKIICPRIGLITNLGQAHQENFSDPQQKLAEKLALFSHSDTIVFCADMEPIARAMERLYPDKKLFTWGHGPHADLSITEEKKEAGSTLVKTRYGQRAYDFKLPFTDEASLENIMHVLALRLAAGMDFPRQEAIASLEPVAMRMEWQQGIHGSLLLNDAYNSDIRSLSIALEHLAAIAGSRPRILVLSDISQSGMSGDQLYGEVARLVKIHGITCFVGIGKEIMNFRQLFEGGMFYSDTASFLAGFDPEAVNGHAVLIKGGRFFRFERIARLLEEKLHTTSMEIDLDALVQNLNFYRSMLAPGVKTMAMVKAASYGHGTHQVAAVLQHQRADYLAVAFADEGVELRSNGIHLPIVVLNPDPVSFSTMIRHRLEPEIYSPGSLRDFIREADRQGEQHYPVHIKLDTGMHRLGFDADDLEQLCRTVKATKSIVIRSVFSHFASSDLPDQDDFNRIQIARFQRMSGFILDQFPGQPVLRHMANTAAIERFPEARFDMVRLGLGLYGISPFSQSSVRIVATLKSSIVQIKEIPADETVGYCRAYRLSRPSRIAILPIGYADGLDRRLSNGGWHVQVNGHNAPVVGNISMDTCAIDITGIEAEVGDSAVVFGQQPTVVEMALQLGTIPYEVLTRVSSRVTRIFIRE